MGGSTGEIALASLSDLLREWARASFPVEGRRIVRLKRRMTFRQWADMVDSGELPLCRRAERALEDLLEQEIARNRQQIADAIYDAAAFGVGTFTLRGPQ